MDKNEFNDALNELSGQVIAIGRALGSERHVYDLDLLTLSLARAQEELQSIVRTTKAQLGLP